jgi:hypothetical protein
MLKTFWKYYKPKISETFDFTPPEGIEGSDIIWLIASGLLLITTPLWLVFFAMVSLKMAIQEKK